MFSKKIITLSFILVSFIQSWAQTVTYSSKSATCSGPSDSGNIAKTVIKITNTATNDSEFTWVTIEQSFQNGWAAQFCDPVSCFGDPIPSTGSFILKPTKTKSFNLDITFNRIFGNGKFTVGVYRNSEPSIVDTLRFLIEGWQLGVEGLNAKAPEMSVFPNPTKGDLTITYPSKGTFGVEVFNLIGSKVKSFSGVQSNAKLDVSELPDGIYIVRINDHGHLVSHRFTKS
jgi:hypothetical protein